jgi:hypothetical protein
LLAVDEGKVGCYRNVVGIGHELFKKDLNSIKFPVISVYYSGQIFIYPKKLPISQLQKHEN